MPTFPLNSVLIADVNVVIFVLGFSGLIEKVLSGCLSCISKMKAKKPTDLNEEKQADLNEEKAAAGEITAASG